jgi:hypothetical protein
VWHLQEAVTPFTFNLLVYALPLLGNYTNSRDRVVAVHGDGGAGDHGFTCAPGTNLRGG